MRYTKAIVYLGGTRLTFHGDDLGLDRDYAGARFVDLRDNARKMQDGSAAFVAQLPAEAVIVLLEPGMHEPEISVPFMLE